MAGYAKMWTFMLSDEWFIGLNNVHRGIFMQLVLICKSQNDNGYVSFTGRTVAAEYMQTPRQTLAYFLSISEPQVCVHCAKPLVLYLPQYVHWQELTVKEATAKNRRKNDTKPDHTIPNQSREKTASAAPKKKKERKKKPAKKPDTRPKIEQFNSWVESHQSELMAIGRIFKKDCSDQYLWSWIKTEVDKARAWVIANPDVVKDRTGWGQQMNTWLRNASGESKSGGGMTLTQEQEHFANKLRSGESTDFTSISEILTKKGVDNGA